MKLIVPDALDRDASVAIAVGVRLFNMQSYKTLVVDRFVVRVTENYILVQDTVSRFAVVKHKQKADGVMGQSWEFNPDCPVAPTSFVTTAIDNQEGYICLYDDARYFTYYDKLEITELGSTTAINTFTFINPILGDVAWGSDWYLYDIDVQEAIPTFNYGEPEAPLSDYGQLFFSYYRAPTGNIEDINDLVGSLKQIGVDEAGVVVADDTYNCWAFNTRFLESKFGGFVFSLPYPEGKRLFRTSVEDYQYVYEYVLDVETQTYSWVDVSDPFSKRVMSTLDYYKFLLGSTTPSAGTADDSSYRITRDVTHDFFKAPDSLYVYRINTDVTIYTPKYSGYGSYYVAYWGLFLKNTVVTVDKLLVSDMTVVETYSLSKAGANTDRRIDKTFDLTKYGIDYGWDSFGFADTNHVLLSEYGTTISSFGSIASEATVTADFKSMHPEGFSCVYPTKGAVLTATNEAGETVEFPFIFGQYCTVYANTNSVGAVTSDNLFTSEESVVCLLGSHAASDTLAVLDSDFDCMRLVNADQLAPRTVNMERGDYTSGGYKADTSYSLASLPRIRWVVSDQDTAYFACGDRNTQVAEQGKGRLNTYEGNVSLVSGTPVLKVNHSSRLAGLDLSTIYRQDGITLNTFSGDEEFTGTVYVVRPKLIGSAEETTKVYVVESFETVDGIVQPRNLHYIGAAVLAVDAGRYVIDYDRVDVYRRYAILDVTISSIPTSYALLFDASSYYDDITVKQGV